MTHERRTMFMLEPGARAVIEKGQPPRMAIPLWLYWVEVARENATAAEAAHASDERVDALSAFLAGESLELATQKEPAGGLHELCPGMTAVVAGAVAVDGLYGTIKPFIDPPASTAKRSRQIIECLKLGFSLPSPESWLRGLDELFERRDFAVHHAELLAEMVSVRETAETIVFGASEVHWFSAEEARRCVDFAVSLIESCLEHPKPPLREWAEENADALTRISR